MCTVFTCGVCGASIVQVPGDAIDRQEQHADWHAAARASAGGDADQPRAEPIPARAADRRPRSGRCDAASRSRSAQRDPAAGAARRLHRARRAGTCQHRACPRGPSRPPSHAAWTGPAGRRCDRDHDPGALTERTAKRRGNRASSRPATRQVLASCPGRSRADPAVRCTSREAQAGQSGPGRGTDRHPEHREARAGRRGHCRCRTPVVLGTVTVQSSIFTPPTAQFAPGGSSVIPSESHLPGRAGRGEEVQAHHRGRCRRRTAVSGAPSTAYGSRPSSGSTSAAASSRPLTTHDLDARAFGHVISTTRRLLR